MLNGRLTPSDTVMFDLSSCNLVSGFNGVNCLTALFIPSSAGITEQWNLLYNGFLTMFPIGYVTDFVSILSNSATTSIPVIDTTIPVGVVGAGSHIKLDLSHSIDYVLYAKASDYGFGTSTQSLYDITSYYWDLVVYALTGFYLIRRIIGSHIIGDLSKKI